MNTLILLSFVVYKAAYGWNDDLIVKAIQITQLKIHLKLLLKKN